MLGSCAAMAMDDEAVCAWSLQDCDLYVLDSCAAVTIDDSKNCRVFIGPTDGRWV